MIANDQAGTVTINLVAPDPVASAVMRLPANTPPKDVGTKPIPGTGTYYFTSYQPNKQLIMKRNPYFKQWSVDAQPQGYVDEIDYSFGLTVEAQITEIENEEASR